jgi:hypothetical protein
VKKTFTCACGKPIVDFKRQTIGIAAEIDFNYKSCKKLRQPLLIDRTMQKKSIKLRLFDVNGA